MKNKCLRIVKYVQALYAENGKMLMIETIENLNESSNIAGL
jgi:hypothetical protein